MREAGPAGHGASNPDDLWVGLRKAGQRLAKYVLIFWCGAGTWSLAFTGDGIEGAGAVEFLRMLDGGLEPLAFFRQDMDEHGHIAMPGELKVADQRAEVVSIDGTDVAEPEFFEEGRFDNEVLRFAFPLVVDAVHFDARGETLEERVDIVVQFIVGRAGAEAIQVVGNRADVLRDRPFVVIGAVITGMTIKTYRARTLDV